MPNGSVSTYGKPKTATLLFQKWEGGRTSVHLPGTCPEDIRAFGSDSSLKLIPVGEPELREGNIVWYNLLLNAQLKGLHLGSR